MSEWQPIETAPTDGTVVVVGKLTDSRLIPAWPIKARFLGDRWMALFPEDEWRPFDPQPTHWKPGSKDPAR